MNEFLILFREALEVALVVGIIATTLVKAGRPDALKAVVAGLGSALGFSVLLGVGFYTLRESVGDYLPLFEAVLLYLASGMLLYMVVWMARRSKGMAKELSTKTLEQAQGGQLGMIAAMVFVATVREGAETVIFLMGLLSMGGSVSILWAFAGMLMAAAIGYLMFVRGKQLPLKQFFAVSSVLLILFSAGMAAYGTHEVEEFLADTGVIDESALVRPYDILKPTTQLLEGTALTFYTQADGKYIHLLHDNGMIGSVLKVLFGYNSNPNWLEFALYFAVLVGGIALWRRNKA